MYSKRRRDMANRDSVVQLFLEIGTSERHFNTIEATYRGLASSWLFASFTAIGFILSRKTLPIHLDSRLLGCAIAVMGIIGITLLWVIDVLVYHQLLDAWFKQGILLEKENPWMIPVRTQMLKGTKGKGVLPLIVWLYITANLALVLVGGVLLASWTSMYGFYAVVGSIAFAGAAGGLIVSIMRKATPIFQLPADA